MRTRVWLGTPLKSATVVTVGTGAPGCTTVKPWYSSCGGSTSTTTGSTMSPVESPAAWSTPTRNTMVSSGRSGDGADWIALTGSTPGRGRSMRWVRHRRWVCGAPLPGVQRARKQLSGSSASGRAGGTIEPGTAWVTRGWVVKAKSRGTSLAGPDGRVLRKVQQNPVAPARPVVNTVVFAPGMPVPSAVQPAPPQPSSGAGSTVVT